MNRWLMKKVNRLYLPLSIISSIKLVSNDLSKFNNIFMIVQLPQDFDFTNCCHWEAFFLLLQTDFFQRIDLIWSLVFRFVNHAKSSFADDVHDLEFFLSKGIDKKTLPHSFQRINFPSLAHWRLDAIVCRTISACGFLELAPQRALMEQS